MTNFNTGVKESGCYDGEVGFGEGVTNEENWDV